MCLPFSRFVYRQLWSHTNAANALAFDQRLF